MTDLFGLGDDVMVNARLPQRVLYSEDGPLPFSFRQLVRQVPSRSLKLFFDSRGIEFGGAVDWSGEQTIVARQINKAMDGMSAARDVRRHGEQPGARSPYDRP
jgi:hypothetical protein